MDARLSSLKYRASFIGPDQLPGVASGTEIRVNRLSPGDGPSHIRQAQSPDHWGLDLTRIHCRVQADGALHPDIMAVLLVFRGVDSTICGVPLRAGMIVTLPPGSAIEANINPGLVHAGAVMPVDQWRAMLSCATGMTEDPGAVRLAPAQTQALTAQLHETFDFLAGSSMQPQSGERLRNTFNAYAMALGEAFAAGEGRYEAIDRTAHRLHRQAHAARDYVCAHLGEPIPIPRLCTAIGVSRRQLEYAFRSTFDVSPREFIYLRRLNEIRRALIAARGDGRTVTDVALEHGIDHLGRFAVNYRVLFGESPSETVRPPHRP